MTLPLERSQTRRPVTWVTLIGVLLLPALIGGILVAALYNPTERLDAMNTAIVNNDEPVEIDGQTTPLGRLLTAGLVEGSDELESNLTWTISNTEDAEAGLADGSYDAIVTIPKDFSAAATSTAPGGDPERATIVLTTPPDARIVDDAITTQVTQTAASILGEQLTSTYLENVLLGFTTLGDQLGEAADGAEQIADGGRQAADGADQLADGAGDAATGAYTLADGIRELSSGAGGLSTGISAIGTGATALSGGARQLATGADAAADGIDELAGGADQIASGQAATADGLDTWSAGAGELATGTSQLADGLAQIADQTAQIPTIPTDVVDGVDALAARSSEASAAVTAAADALADISATCLADGGTAEVCAALADASAQANAALPDVQGLIGQSGTIATQVRQLSDLGPQLTAALRESASGAQQLSEGMTGLADGADDLAAGSRGLATGTAELASGAGAAATGVRQLSDGADDLADGAGELASGAGQLADGARTFAAGAGTAASGTESLADGVGQLADGAGEVSDGVGQLADGTGDLADGLDQAVDGIPSYSDDEAKDLASIVANPVAAEGTGTSLFGASAVPLLAMLALWFGGLASFVALQAVPRGALSSRRPSVLLALRALAPGAAIGAAQGLLVAGVVQLAAEYEVGPWSVFAALCVVAGIAFAAVNQALVAIFGGAGRWVATLIGVVALGTGIVSTIPGVLADIAGLLPTAPAYSSMLAALTESNGIGAGIIGMTIWAVLAVVASVLAVARQRSTSAGAVLAQPA
ncbi:MULTISPECIES: YhgE/Pip family protein [unclassified Microbacterium]|uniref:YhgE/Pip family protein n=1 Tax=unclassified Microbacterium TaxID=2609290 RepID=UPI00386A85D6